MSVNYTRINWEDSPSTQTPLNAENLNAMDSAIDELASAVNNLDGVTDDIEELQTDVGAIKNDLSDGTFTVNNAENAEQLTATVGIEDNAPYLFRTSGGSNDIGDREEVRKLVGGTIAWNQFVRDGDLSQPSGYWSSKVVISGGYGTVNPSQKYDSGSQRLLDSPFVVNHKFLLLFLAKADTPEVLACGIGDNVTFTYTKSFNATSLWGSYGSIFSIPTSLTGTNQIIFIRTELDSGFAPFSFDNVMFTDLTQMLGTSIADYIYALETATAGAGVAWLKKHFPAQFDAGYQAYDPGSLQSVSGLTEHRMNGFNQWDESLIGDTNANYRYFEIPIGKTNLLNMTLQDKDVSVDLSGVYFGFFVNSADSTYGCRWIIANGSVQSNKTNLSNNNILCSYLVVYPKTEETLNKIKQKYNICVNISWDGERDGEYEPYKTWSYALDDSITLRGIPKVDASGNLYYDGDEYLPDGTVNRRYGLVDMGTLAWRYNETYTVFWADLPGVLPSVSSGKDNARCSKYAVVVTNEYGARNLPDKNMMANSSFAATSVYAVVVKDSAYTDAETFKTAMSGVYLIYEKNTPTTETAEPYQSTQIVDDFGTEEFVLADTAFPVPVGHDTMYQNNLRAKLEMSPDSPDGDGLYVVQQESGENTYVPLASTATIQDILTRLTALENA